MPPKKRREPRSLKRISGTKPIKMKIIAFCEGKNTEPLFLRDFSLLEGNGMVAIEPVPAAGVPLTIVKKASEMKKELDKISKKSKDPLDSSFQVWAIFDCDEHPDISQAFDKAYANGVRVAYSNPCFELWPLLYLREQNSAVHRHVLQKDLEKTIKGYNSKGSKTIDLDMLDGDYATAKKRAIQLKERHEKVASPMANPYTDVYELFDEIIKYGKPKC